MGSKGSYADPHPTLDGTYLSILASTFTGRSNSLQKCFNKSKKRKTEISLPSLSLDWGFPHIVTEREFLLFKSLYIHKLISRSFYKNAVIFMPTAYDLFNRFIYIMNAFT